MSFDREFHTENYPRCFQFIVNRTFKDFAGQNMRLKEAICKTKLLSLS